MDSIFVELDSNIPRYACTACNKCSSKFGHSLCYISNRGCCWYFPKFTLVEIQRMLKTDEGRGILEQIISNPNTVFYSSYIHAKGFFDELGYNLWKTKPDAKYPEDSSYLFKACPFVKKDKGCILPPRYRTIVCNFYLCDELLSQTDQVQAEIYITERTRYASWFYRENRELESILRDNHVCLKTDRDQSFKILSSLEIYEYDFPILSPMYIGSDFDGFFFKGA